MAGYWGPSNLQQAGANLPVPLYRDERLLLYEEDMEDLDPTRMISLSSVTRVGIMALLATALAYVAVVPRSAPTQQYNYLFKLNVLLLLSSMAWPTLLLGLMYNARDVNVNDVVRTFFTAFTSGYVLSFLSEVVLATAVKLGALLWLEPGIADACRDVPVIYLPWVWKDRCGGYRPKLYTLLGADLIINCVACPVIEEAMKLACYRWCTYLRRPPPAYNGPPPPRTRPETVHSTLVYMVAASLGLKAADNTRRILLYTKPQVRPFRTLLTLQTEPKARHTAGPVVLRPVGSRD